MKGVQHIEVSNRDAKFKFDLYRNITVVRGDSGTGKTTLYDMIADYTRLKDSSGVNISCQKDCIALVDLDWKNQLGKISDSIVFIDEGTEYLKTQEFAKAVKSSDNYYVIFSRENMHELPYSAEEIYEIEKSGRFHSFVKMYKSNASHFYGKNQKNFKFEILLTEDSKSGYQFYDNYFKNTDIKCSSSGSNAAIFKRLSEEKGKNILVIADGAAFGAEIDRVLKLQSAAKLNFRLCLPESFEWLILKSGLVKTEDIEKILDNPSEYIESSIHFSWENFFEKYLIQNTVKSCFKYSKDKINSIYLIENNSKKIAGEIFHGLEKK